MKSNMVDETRRTEGTAPRASAGQRTHDLVLHALRSSVGAGRVLDVPCGTGAFLHALQGAPYQRLGADRQPGTAPPGAQRLVLDMSDPLPLASESLDAIVSIEGIEHIRRPFDFIAESRRVLRTGGRLFLTTPNISCARSRWRWFLTGFHNKAKCPLDERRPALRHHINVLSFPALRYMLHTEHFEIETVRTNRIKAAALAYAPLWPFQYAVSRVVFWRNVRDAQQARIARQVLRQMLSPAVFFGEALIVTARASS